MINPLETPESRRLVRMVARHASHRLSEMPLQERADLLEGIALLLDGQEADEAAAAANMLRQAEAAQMHFTVLISQE